jgi:phosphoribosylformimino-5-aminoimidazole carboxamide ribotide isomerase
VVILPAIDLRAGQCVRLRQGDYNQETVFDADPAAAARRWVEQGAAFLHLVDLDGAKAGHPVNGDSIQKIVREADVPCQLGGGLRDEEHVARALGWGVRRVIIGTRAVKDPAWLGALCVRYPELVVLGIDAKNGRVATEGWLEVSDVSALELARRCEEWPLAAIVYTDIGRDGMLAGPNAEAMAELAARVRVPVIASGGVTTLDDIRAMKKLGLAGCIVGRALYEGRLDLKQALDIASAG